LESRQGPFESKLLKAQATRIGPDRIAHGGSRTAQRGFGIAARALRTADAHRDRDTY
jgi:hypothetical protein